MLSIGLQSFAQTDQSAFQPYNTQGENLIHVATADFDGVGAKDYVVAMNLQGKVIAYQRPDLITSPTADNKLWEYSAGLPSMAIRILAEDIISSSAGDEVLLPGTDGHLRVLSATGQLLYDKVISTGALYAVTVGKNNKGETIIVTSGVDGVIHILDDEINEITTVRPKTNSTANVSGLIRHVLAGDFNGDGADEVAIFINRKNFQGSCFIDLIDLSTFSRPAYWNGETAFIEDDTTPNLGFTDKQLPFAYDMDKDGNDEIVAHWGVFHPENGTSTKKFSTMLSDNEKIKLSDYQNFAQQFLIDNHGFKSGDKEKLTNTGKYLMQHGLPGDFDNDGEAELFTLYGDDLFLSDYNSSTKTLDISTYTWAHTEYHFSSIALLQDRNGGHDKIVLSGPINGDDHFYVVDVTDSNWTTQARTINGRGVLGEVNQNLDQLTLNLDGMTSETNEENDPIWYVGSSFGGWLGWVMTPESCVEKAQASYDAIQEWQDKIGGNSRVRLAVSLNTAIYGETSQDEHVNITKDGVIELCKAYAQKGVYFSVTLGHGNHTYMTPETFSEIYEASIVNGECYMMARTKELKSAAYFDLYTPHLDAVLEKATQLNTKPPMVMLLAKGAIFSILTQQQGDDFFPKYKDVLVPGVENSNVGVQDWSISERVGLWMNGDVKNWGCNVIGDNISANRVAEWGGMRNAHVVLRQLLSQYSLGAKVFRLTSVTNKENPLYLRGDVTNPNEAWSQPYEKGIINFLKIVESGSYPHPTSPSEVKGISPVSVALYNRSDRLSEQSYKHDHDKYTPTSQVYVLNKMACWDAYTDVPNNDVTSYIFGAERRWDNLLPSSSGGFVTIVPHETKAEVEQNEWCEVAYQTDGDNWEDYSLSQGKQAIEDALNEQKQNLDFYVDGECFWQTVSKSDDNLTYYLMVMGNKFLTAEENTVTIKAGNSINGECVIYDQMTNSSVGALYSQESEVSITIPRGIPRIFRIELASPPKIDLVLNGDFEELLMNWESWNNVSAVSSDPYYGNYAAQINGKGSLSQIRKVQPNTTYTLSAFAKVLDPENAGVLFSVKDMSNNILDSVTVMDTEYTSYRLKFTTPENVDSVKIAYWRSSDGIDKSFLDEVVLKETAYIRNADFEKDYLGWDYYGGAAFVTDDGIIPTSSLRITEKGGASQWIKTEDSTTYEISFTTMLEDPTKTANFYAKDLAGNKYFEQKIDDITPTTYTLVFTTNVGEEDTKIGFWRGANAIGNAWIDNITINKSSANERVLTNEIDSEVIEGVKIYPNPASDFVMIKADHMEGVKTVSILNIMGQTVLVTSFEGTLKLPISSLQKGTYIVDISDKNGKREVEKLIVK